MKIQTITAVNVKGRDFTHSLGPVTVVVGDNFSGKTAILDAIRIGLLGYHSRLGKQGSKLWKLAGQSKMEMSVLLEFDEDKRIFNHWTQKADGAVSLNSQIPDELQTPAVLLDANEYFNRTSAERVAFIFDKTDPASLGFDETTLVEKISSIEVVPAVVCREVLPKIVELVRNSIERRKATKASIQSWLAELVEAIKAAKKFADQLKKKSADTIQGSKPAGPIPKSVADALATKESELNAVLKQLEDIRVEAERMAKHQNRITELKAIASGPEVEEAVLVEKIERIKGAAIPLVDLKADNTRLGELRSKSATLKSKIVDMEKAAETIDAETQKHLAGKACPTCKSKGDGWKVALAEETKIEIEAIRKNIATIEKDNEATITEGVALKTAIEAKEKANKINADKNAEIAKLESDLAAVRAKNAAIVSAREQLQTITDAGNNAPVAALDDLKAKETKLGEEIKALRAQQALFDAHQTAKAKSAGAEKEGLRYQVESEICKQAVAAIVAAQEAVIATAFESILSKAHAFTNGILRAPLAYRDGDFGMETEDGWVSSDVFSGLEQTLSYAALCVALAQTAPIKIVLMDELGILSPKYKDLVLTRMAELTRSGVIDQFVSADAGVFLQTLPEGVTFIPV